MRTIGIIGGKGLIGSFLAKFFRGQGFRVIISDVKTPLSNVALVQTADVVIVSVPIHVTKKVIREIVPHTRRGQILADVTSLKTFPVREMLKSKASVIGLHPMFRPGPYGVKGQTMVLCPARCSKSEKKWLAEIFKKSGMIVAEMSAKKHDHLMGVVQALIHFHSLVLGGTLRSLNVNLRDVMKVMSPIYRMQFDVVCRIFAQSPLLYAAIGMENPETKKITRHFLRETENLHNILTQKNRTAFMKNFKKTAAFLGPLSLKAQKESDLLLEFLAKK